MIDSIFSVVLDVHVMKNVVLVIHHRSGLCLGR